MKLTIATLLLSPVFASKAAKYGKFSKVKAKATKSGYRSSMSMSASMSFGPPPITLTACGESFTNQKVVLTKDLDCGPVEGVPPQPQQCAVTLDGPFAEINCDGNTLSQVASSPGYGDGPYTNGICLNNGSKARNCNVQKFYNGIYITDGAEVVESNLTPNFNGIVAQFTKDSTLTIENTEASSNSYIGLGINVRGANTDAKLIVKGENTFNSNEIHGMYTSLLTNTNLEINVKRDATLETCGNFDYDIEGEVNVGGNLIFSGDGSYTCSSKQFIGDGTIVPPDCQDCLSN